MAFQPAHRRQIGARGERDKPPIPRRKSRADRAGRVLWPVIRDHGETLQIGQRLGLQHPVDFRARSDCHRLAARPFGDAHLFGSGFLGRTKAQHGAACKDRQAVRLAGGAGQALGAAPFQRVGHRLVQCGLHLHGVRPLAATGGRRWRADRTEAGHISRTARLGPGARQPLTPEGLRPDNRPDLVAVDVDIARLHRLGDVLDPVVDAGVQPEGQAEALGIHVGNHLVDVARLEGRHMQDRAEHLFVHLPDAGHPDRDRSEKAALLRCGNLVQHPTLGAGLGDIGCDIVAGRGRDDRSQIGCRIPRVGNRQLVHRAFQHLQERGRDILLDVETTQRRTALARRLEAGGHDITLLIIHQIHLLKCQLYQYLLLLLQKSQ